ncbi:LysR family transcriptional regulator [Jiangella alkaliphila]|uniref:DNA-binding transcriptional regulator, LysR family n=1 Tax=Jiangella alkaliphila TaxID=419479 RepID=A0A1H2K1J6_9ACTN|nr:LysR family transcriptional regulator [Jiangella alkaliphila]SDU62584.1 DNA-binding transcriptional regulator, LysR family [Jiangella alkaliphila]
MELRDIEIFLTLSEELHFGRTAERLHLTPARVSQSIKKQERRVGGLLFERTSRHVTLTPLGAQLRDDLRAGYDAIRTGLARATETASGVVGTLRLGVMGNDSSLFLRVLGRFRRGNPGCDLEIREIHFSDPFGPLRSEQADVVVLWRPVREPDLTVGPTVFTVGRVLAVAAGHELAGRASVSLEDLADHVRIDPAGRFPDYWLEALLPAHTPSGRPVPRRGPRPRTVHEILTLVAAGECVTPIGAQASLYAAHPGVCFVPIHDAPPTEWALVWRTSAQTPLIRAFAGAAADVGPSTLEDVTATVSRG